MKELVIIEINASSDGSHGIQSQSGRTECWVDGWIEVPSEFVETVWKCRGYCDLEIVDGVLVNVMPIEIPKVDPAPTQLDILEAQVTYTAMMTDTLLEV